jgi:hypothetical protein
MRFLALITLFFMLAGCLSTKPSDLKKHSAAHYEFDVDQPLSFVAKRVYSRLSACYIKPITASGKELEVHDLREQGQFDIYYKSVGSLGIYIIGAFIKGISDTDSHVRVAYHGPWEPSANAVERWVRDDYTECHVHQFSDNLSEGLKELKTLTFEVDVPSKISFDLVSLGLTQCLDARDGALNKRPINVDSIFQNEKRAGYVTAGMYGFTFSYKVRAEITDKGPSKSLITVKYDEDMLPTVNLIEKWFKGGSIECTR